MFYPAEMCRVTIGIHDAYLTPGIENLHETGIMEVIPLRDDASTLHGILDAGDRSSLTDRCAGYRLRIDRILDAFREVPSSVPRILTHLLAPEASRPVFLSALTLHDLFAEIDLALSDAEPVLGIRAGCIKIREELEELADLRSMISLLLPLDIDLSALGDSAVLSVTAFLTASENAPGFIRQIEDAAGDELYLSRSSAAGAEVILLAYPAQHREAIEGILHDPDVTIIRPGTYSGLPAQALAKIDSDIRDLRDREREHVKALEEMKKSREQLFLALREDLQIRRDELDLVPRCGKTGEVTVVQGFVPAKEVAALARSINGSTGENVYISHETISPGSDEAPIEYENPGPLRPFEYLTTMFARPRYGEVDPTPFLAPIFLLFFGLMLGDAGYGILITLCGLLIFRGAGRVSPIMHDLSWILIWCGVSAVIFGTLQGGWFGDVPTRFLGITPPLVLIEPLKDPIAFFQISLILGVIHINLGLFLALYQNYRNKLYRACILEQGVWFIIQPSAGVLLADFFGWAFIPPDLRLLATIGILVGVAMIFYSRGPMGFFSLTGFLGDWLSYVRILALALATGGIAMTVNILSELIGGISPLLLIPAILVFLGGQAFNLVIQSLGGVIHAIRLQYIEFFGKFYHGGGKGFAPFRMDRVYSARSERR